MRTLPETPTTRMQPVVDTLHGQTIVDSYRWLEDAQSPETRAWVDAQNAHTRALLDHVSGRDAIQERLTALLSIGVVTAPVVRNGRYFYLRREGRQNQPVLYLREGADGEEQVLLDLNTVSEEGTVALDWWFPSWDGKLLAYGYSASGNEWSTLSVLDIDRTELLPDRIERARYASVAWLPDGSGFYYSRYPRLGQVPPGEENYHRRLFFHLLGSDPDTDPEVHVAELEPEDMIAASISRDGRYLIASVGKGWSRTDVYLRDLSIAGSSFQPVAVGYDALFGAQIVGGTMYLQTNLDAPRYRLFAVDPAHTERSAWQEIVPEPPHALLDTVTLAGGQIVAGYLANATSSLAVYDAGGTKLYDVQLPTLGTVTAVRGEWDEPEAFFSCESFTVPTMVYRLDLSSRTNEIWERVGAPVRADDFVVTQEWYTSRDGTGVSMFIVHRRDLDRSRPQPTCLTGYGGFNISRTPLFARSLYLWLEQGGIFALPNLRGGSEYGEEWHRAGMLDRKQNVFDDFLAAAEYLIAQGYTDSSRLAIYGGSNGGLLVGAALTQRPELFRAVVCSVPLLDMLRYHQFLIARLWIAEYGSADDPEQFPFLYAYSPYHHVVSGTCYPAVLLTTAESDTRVDPLHARKMAALLQAANASEHPILLRVETRAGHGIGKPLTKLIDEQTDFWTFIFWQLEAPISRSDTP